MNQLAQRLAIDKLHRDEMHAFSFANLIDVSDVRMIQRGRGLRLLNEAPHSIGVSREIRRQNFERDIAIELVVARAKHFAHSARADL